MTKEELEKEIKNYIDKNCEQWETDGLTVDDIVRIAVLDFAEPREEQIQIDAEQIRALQKQNGELTDELTKKADTNHQLVEQLAKMSEENAELEAQIERMKCCMKCEHWYYYKSFCDKDNSYHSEGQSCEHFILRR